MKNPTAETAGYHELKNKHRRHSALDAESRTIKDWIPTFVGMTK